MLPFNWKTPFGYFVGWFSQTAACTAIIVADIPYFTLIFASSWLFVTIADDLTQELAAWNNDIRASDGLVDHDGLVHHFCDMVRCYTEAKG